MRRKDLREELKEEGNGPRGWGRRALQTEAEQSL